MIKWGISANSHNAAIAVFDEDTLVFASESERFSKRKNDPHLNRELVRHAKLFGEPEMVYWYEDPTLKTMRQQYVGQSISNDENNIKKYLLSYDVKAPIKYYEHHYCHAAGGYFTSSYDDACIVVIDAIGEFETLTIWSAQGNKLKKLWSRSYPHSIGLWYSAMTQRCGLKPNEEEYILMGMAALGDPDKYYNQIIKDFVNIKQIKIKQNLHRGCKTWLENKIEEKDYFNVAAASQKIYEEVFENILQKAQKLCKSNNLVLAGGCALNCLANRLAYKYYDNVWIMPAPGDNGSAIGAVLANHKKHIFWPGPFLGYDLGQKASNYEIVSYINKYEFCGIARGKAEFGPRAFGNRSLIGDPRVLNLKERINFIKQREEFRPFAPAILEEKAHEYFDIPQNKSSRYMQFVYKCKYPDIYPSIVHYDGTSRIQTVPEDGSAFRQLLEEWYFYTGCPMLLNTSLNIKGEPMINNEKDIERWVSLYAINIFT